MKGEAASCSLPGAALCRELLFAGHGLGSAHEALVLVLQRAHHGGHVALLLLGLLLGGLLEPDFKIGKIVSDLKIGVLDSKYLYSYRKNGKKFPAENWLKSP
jgi:hypothetical protein